VFTVDTARRGADGQVVAQSPKAGSQVAPDAPVQLWMKPPTYDKDEQLFDVLEYEVPKLVVRVPIRVELVTRDTTSVLLDMSYHPGGLLTLPYVAPKSGEIVVWIDDREVARTPADRERR
jgi:hypothetical protein